MSDEFSQPASGGGFFKPADALGHLVLFTKVHDVYHNPTNVYKGKSQPRDEAKVDMVDLDGDGFHRERVTVTHPGLVNRLTTGASNVLGRVGQIVTDNGEAYVLNKYEDADLPQARAWMQSFQAGQFSQGQSKPQSQANAPAQVQAQPSAQTAPQVAPTAAPGTVPGVDAAQLAALVAQLQAGQAQAAPQGQNPPF